MKRAKRLVLVALAIVGLVLIGLSMYSHSLIINGFGVMFLAIALSLVVLEWSNSGSITARKEESNEQR